MNVIDASNLLQFMRDEGYISEGSRSVKTNDCINATEIHCHVWEGWEDTALTFLQQYGDTTIYPQNEALMTSLCICVL